MHSFGSHMIPGSNRDLQNKIKLKYSPFCSPEESPLLEPLRAPWRKEKNKGKKRPLYCMNIVAIITKAKLMHSFIEYEKCHRRRRRITTVIMAPLELEKEAQVLLQRLWLL